MNRMGGDPIRFGGQNFRTLMGRAARALLAVVICLQVAWADEGLKKTSRKGPVEATVQLEPLQPRIGDAVTLTLEVVAEKGIELIMPEFGQVMDRFPIIDFVKDERIDDQGRTIATHRYTFQLTRSGKQNILPILVEFVDHRSGSKPAPDGFDSYELLTDHLAFEVKSVLPNETDGNLNPSLGKLSLLRTTAVSPWVWIAGILLLVTAAYISWRYWLMSRQKARRQSAYEVAMRRLTELVARSRNDPGQIDAFFVELSAIVRWYLENRFDLRAPELTTEEFLESMSWSPDLTGE
ncbi:MAG: hypothetical protein GTO40_27635, partial [Deltaproteobacteria bacterium]|nr:hypothetical protein [Deltaproteobacteria bacterium]